MMRSAIVLSTVVLAGCATVAYLPPDDPVAARLAECIAAANQSSYSVRPGSEFALQMKSYAAYWQEQLVRRLPDAQQQKQALAWGAARTGSYRPGGGMSGMMSRGAAVGSCAQELGQPPRAEAANG